LAAASGDVLVTTGTAGGGAVVLLDAGDRHVLTTLPLPDNVTESTTPAVTGGQIYVAMGGKLTAYAPASQHEMAGSGSASSVW
jgi:hypothetical protein